MTIRDFMRVHNTRVFRENVIFRFIGADYTMQNITERIFYDSDKWDEIVKKWYDRVIEEITYVYSNNNIIIRIEVE